MPFNQDQENYIRSRFLQVEKQELNDENWNIFVTNLNEQILAIENCINEEINLWINNNHSIRLIVLGEAPLSFNKFFYNTQGIFLYGFNNYYNIANVDLKHVLRQNGIFVLDTYKFHIKTGYYDGLAGAVLYDEEYLNNKFQELRNLGLINDNTKIVFRYIKLFRRNYILRNLNIHNNHLTNESGEPVSLYIGGEYGYVTLSPEVINFLQNN